MSCRGSLGQPCLFDYTASVRTSAHRFLLMLLMLALPLQTLAAASMMACAMPQQAAVEHTAMADEAMTGCHESEPSPATPHNCKHCATCVLASALPIPAFDSAAIIPAAQRYVLQPSAAFSGFFPSGPERPPRTPIA